MLREGMFIADRYEVIDKIGSGGMSEVYKAMDHKLNRYVAIKVLKSDYSEDKTFVTKFRAEAQSAAGLMHSNIVNVYDVGEEDGLHYIVMELVEGITLKKYIERKGHLGTREAVSIAIQVAQGIEAAHKHHIVHRDIKPQNIIISKEGKVKVTDFGIARAATSNTINSAVMGSVHYISPEQARGGYSDEKSDIYSFGITLFEMITGRVPFEGDSTVSVALKHIQDDMVSPKSIISDLPISVEKIVLKCTQKKTERRYQNISDLIVDLKRSLVTPDEDFVIISTAIPADGATHIIGEDDLIEISQRSANKSAVSDAESDLSYHDDDEDIDEYDTDMDDDSDAYDDDADDKADTDDDEEYDDDDEEDGPKRNKTLDLIITIAGIVLAIGILVATVLIIKNMLGSEGGEQRPSKTQEQTESTDEVRVPNLAGMTYEVAKDYLLSHNLGIAKKTEYSADYDKDKIFDQMPKAGETVKQNTTITVIISLGEPKNELENVVGMTQEEAEELLRSQGVIVDFEYEETDDEDKIGKVAQTNPSQGTPISKDQKVTVVVYIGSKIKNVIVPKLVGLKESEARKALEDLKLEVGDVTEVYDSKTAKGLVISQSGPEEGKEAPEGTKVNFVVSLGAEPETEAPTQPEPAKVVTPNVVGKSEETAKSEILSAKLKVGVVSTEHSDTVAAGLVISQSVAAGSAVNENTEVNLVVSLGANKVVKYSSEMKINKADIEAEMNAVMAEAGITSADIKSITVDIHVIDKNAKDETIWTKAYPTYAELEASTDIDVSIGEPKDFAEGAGYAYASITFYKIGSDEKLVAHTYSNHKIAITITKE